MSYKKVLITGSKNILEIPTTQGYPSNTAFSNDTKRTWTTGTYIVGLVRSNYYAPNNVSSYSVTKTTVSFTTTAGGYGIAIPVKLEAGKSYTLSANRTGYFGQTFYKEDGTMISFGSSSTFTVPADTVWTTIVLGADIGVKATFSNIQLEEGATATNFVPPYCESYKRALIASNNPIQLFNSSLNPGNTTKSGITMTNNGDGTFTFNGTSTAWAFFSFQSNLSLYAGHKILMTGCPSGGSYTTYYMDINYTGADIGSGGWMTISEKSNEASLSIGPNQTVSNLVYKPQIIDFTAIFGAGNEPKNLAEAKTKFAQYFSTEAVYPYNPSYCASPKSALITPTKNLFDLNSANIVDHTTYFTPAGGAGTHFYKMTVESGATYSVSFDLYTNGALPNGLALGVQTGDHYGDGKKLAVNLRGKESATEFYPHTTKFAVPTGITEVTFSGLGDNQYRNFQIEKGITATSYVHYNYI